MSAVIGCGKNETVLPKIFSGTGSELMFHFGASLIGTNQITAPM